jgi:histidinol-phosphate aminotransferase
MKQSIVARLCLEDSSIPVHGALDYTELERLGLRPEEVLDFSSNINPYGPPPAVLKRLSETSFAQYPDRDTIALRRALSMRFNLPEEQILVGNGSAELLLLAAIAFLRPADRVLVIAPTFGEYVHVSKLMEAEIHQVIAQAEAHFKVDSAAVADLLAKHRYRLVFLCNPNNPTGQVITHKDLRDWVSSQPETLFVVDEAYLPFNPQVASALDIQSDNVLVLRSMTKDYALAGLRLGYAVASPDVIQALRLAQPPWSVNALAQTAGLAALADESYLSKTVSAVLDHKIDLITGLQANGFQPVPSQTHFFLLPVGDGQKFRGRLLRRGIQVRDCNSFGLPVYVRISTRLPEENARLLAALEMEAA